MQGTVPTPLKCSVQIDTLGKECLKLNEGIYKYKGCVSVPPLSFIEDVVGITECSVNSVQLNAMIQRKINHKKLQLSQPKCYKWYLGDILKRHSRLNKNIEGRYNKGLGIVNQILAILKEVSFGHFYFEMALLFKHSMLIKSILCNFEVLYGLTKSHIETIESVDKYFMKRIFQCPISTPVESYFIDTNVMPFRFVIMGRRLMYYHTLLQKEEKELVKSVFLTRQKLSVKND